MTLRTDDVVLYKEYVEDDPVTGEEPGKLYVLNKSDSGYVILSAFGQPGILICIKREDFRRRFSLAPNATG